MATYKPQVHNSISQHVYELINEKNSGISIQRNITQQ